MAILDRTGEFAVDLADESAVRAIAQRIGPRDVLVHAAATFERVSLADIDLPTWRHVQAVNVEAALWLCQALAPGMAQRASVASSSSPPTPSGGPRWPTSCPT